MTRARSIPVIALFVTEVFLTGCTDDVSSPSNLPSRTFRMGFSPIPPKSDFNSLVASLNMWSTRADAAILSFEVPWDSLLAGVPAESVAVRNLLGLENYFRSKGFLLWLYVDPANGLNR